MDYFFKFERRLGA